MELEIEAPLGFSSAPRPKNRGAEKPKIFIPPQRCERLLNSDKMLYLIGLGLSDETDITVKGLEIVKRCSRVYLESYTAILLVDKEVLVRPLPLFCFQADTDV